MEDHAKEVRLRHDAVGLLHGRLGAAVALICAVLSLVVAEDDVVGLGVIVAAAGLDLQL